MEGQKKKNHQNATTKQKTLRKQREAQDLPNPAPTGH